MFRAGYRLFVTPRTPDSYSSCHGSEYLLSFIVEIEGYRARIERDRDGILHGRVLGMEEMVYFKAPTARLIETRFASALETYFEMCKQKGVEPLKPNGPSF